MTGCQAEHPRKSPKQHFTHTESDKEGQILLVIPETVTHESYTKYQASPPAILSAIY